jgi:hypothetical protein
VPKFRNNDNAARCYKCDDALSSRSMMMVIVALHLVQVV